MQFKLSDHFKPAGDPVRKFLISNGARYGNLFFS